MNKFARTLLVAVSLPACLALAETKPAPAPAAKGDDLWTKVEESMQELQNPKERPKTREEAIEKMKTGLGDFDKAVSAFEAKNPKDARRWQARLFSATTLDLRSRIGMESKGDMQSVMKEIIAAADAGNDTKGDASAILVLEGSHDAEEGKVKMADWIASAETHLKAYPDSRLSKAVEQALSTQKTKAELKTKPLDIKFTAIDGTEVDLAKLRGKVVLVDFWATWCGPCVAELPNVLKAYEKLHEKGFEIVGISLDQSKEKLEEFVKDRGMKWPQYFDGKGWENDMSRRFGIQSIPAMWLLNKKGMLVSTEVRGKLEEMVEKELNEK